MANALLLTGVCWRFVPAEALEEPRSASWVLSVWLSYPWLFLLPAYGVAALAGRGAAACLRRPDAAPLAGLVVASFLFSVVQLTVAADQRVLDLYGFHLNGFVWNLLTTRGGIAALGAGPETYRALAVLAAAALLLQGAAAFAAARVARRAPIAARLASRAVVVPLLLGLVALTGYERLAFGAARPGMARSLIPRSSRGCAPRSSRRCSAT